MFERFNVDDAVGNLMNEMIVLHMDDAKWERIKVINAIPPFI